MLLPSTASNFKILILEIVLPKKLNEMKTNLSVSMKSQRKITINIKLWWRKRKRKKVKLWRKNKKKKK